MSESKTKSENVENVENVESTPGMLARLTSFAARVINTLLMPVKFVWSYIGGFCTRLARAGVVVGAIVGIGFGTWTYRVDIQALAGIDPRPEANLATLLQEGAELRREADTMRNKAEGIRISVAIKAPTEARHLSTEQLADATLRIQAILNALADNDRSPVTVNVNSAPVAGTQTSAYAYLVVCSNGTTNVDIYDAKGLTEAFAIMGVTVSVPNLSGSGWLGTWAEGRFGIRWGGESLF